MGTNSAGSFGIGFLIGSVVGLALGMLYAPRTGREIREVMKGKTVEAKQSAERIIEDARDRAERIVERAKSRAVKMLGGDKAVAAETEIIAE